MIRGTGLRTTLLKKSAKVMSGSPGGREMPSATNLVKLFSSQGVHSPTRGRKAGGRASGKGPRGEETKPSLRTQRGRWGAMCGECKGWGRAGTGDASPDRRAGQLRIECHRDGHVRAQQ
eukprot:3693851-Prymnesium_polylepis.1